MSISISVPEPVNVVENVDPVNITCEAVCNPECGYVWTAVNGTDVSSDEFLYMDKLTRYQAGVYRCIANNSLGFMAKDTPINVFCKFYFTRSHW